MILNPHDYIITFIVVGDSGVGKTALFRQFVEKEFHLDTEPTVGQVMVKRSIPIPGKNLCLRLTDTGGQERFRAITRQYYRGAAGILLVYDVTNRKSFNNLVDWLEDIRRHAGANATIMLVGNKRDLEERIVRYDEGEAFAREHHLLFIETSAQDTGNTEDAFVNTAIEICQKIDTGLLRDESYGIRIGRSEPPAPSLSEPPAPSSRRCAC
ncbi:Ras- protein Rab-2A [Mortierella polycephala]|uniref:Ras- protein Rab-2A n=1 Tax=Mortierella polycephala TaxID=41804 RepID=A0A9P6TY69_9FUNG|nr:Ras- protein Rab-2A [Mortierella polycephala]